MRIKIPTWAILIKIDAFFNEVKKLPHFFEKDVMKNQSQNLMNFIEAIPDALIVINKNKIIQFVNQHAVLLFGCPRESLINHSVEVIMPKQEHELFSEYYAHYVNKAATKASETCIELTGIKHNKTLFPVELFFGTWEVDHDSLTIIIFRDLTFHTQLCNINEVLEHSNRSKEQFLTTMSHQLRTPLNAVLGFSELLLMKLAGELTNEQEKQISIIHKSGKHLLALVNDLSDLARIDAGEISFTIKELSAQELISDIINTLTPLAESKQLNIIVQWPDKEIIVNSDKGLLTQIITNIINNAIKFTHEGSVTLKLSQKNNKAILEVIDTGEGIKEDKMDRLFCAFQQLFIGEKKTEGSGLGLHISKKLADLLDVQLKVTSEYGKGTHFSISIPLDSGLV